MPEAATIEAPAAPATESTPVAAPSTEAAAPAASTPAAPPTETAQFSAAHDKADADLARRMVEAGDESPEIVEAAKGPQRDANGRFAPKGEEAKKDDAAPVETVTTDPADEAKAIAALRRDGWTEEDIKALPEKRRVEMGLKRAKVQADVDGYTEKFKEAEKALAELQSQPPKEPQANGKPAETTESEQRIDWSEYVQPLAEAYGDEIAEPLSRAFDGITRRLSDGFERVLAQRDQYAASMGLVLKNMIYGQARSALTEQFPELKDDAMFAKVREQAEKLISAPDNPYGGDENANRLIEHAASVALAPVIAKRVAEQRRAEHQRRDNGTPDAPSTRGESTTDLAGMTPDQLNDAALEARMSGDNATADQAERLRDQKLRHSR